MKIEASNATLVIGGIEIGECKGISMGIAKEKAQAFRTPKPIKISMTLDETSKEAFDRLLNNRRYYSFSRIEPLPFKLKRYF
ncbi:hypothetical protein D5018_03890 [Parashewanella curva]|uniref:Uncharacterized protein n=1 Tax=Parashewanella curva TaxID=2338552 RepID=A0A3L8Q2G1_9GAMM|nr:hypothetical protein [Parashewanella curva]RLV60993.1 hypothetical protein D5018_03890 [Parashewanella curva]